MVGRGARTRAIAGPIALAVVGAFGPGCGGADSRGAPDPGALAVIDYADGTRVSVLSLSPDPATPGEPVVVVLDVEAGAPVDLEVVSWPPRIGGRELVLGSGVDAATAARPEDPRVSRVALDDVAGALEVSVPLALPWSPRTAMITVARRDGATIVPAVDGPRTRDGLGTAGLVDVTSVPVRLVATRVEASPELDGVLDEAAWSSATAVRLGDSLEGEPVAIETSVRALWDDEMLYVGAILEDDDVWSQFEAQDDPLWKEEAFEFFLFGEATRRRYLELQVSPRGVTFDARFDTYRKGDEAWDGPWRAAAAVDGTVRRRDDRDRQWSVEMAVPFAMICEHTAMACPPVTGATTRVNAFRLDRPRRGPPQASSLAPTRVPDFHAPELAAVLELGP